METQWYYVQGSERVGPVSKQHIYELYGNGELQTDSYVWKKGFSDWKHLNTVEDFKDLDENTGSSLPPDTEEKSESQFNEQEESLEEDSENANIENEAVFFDLDAISNDTKVFSLKIGHDRDSDEAEFGPYSLDQLSRFFQEKRINEKTYIFTPGMENWVHISDFGRSKEIIGDSSVSFSDSDRRITSRKPFVARLFFHDNVKLYEGVCRDISIGGLQILVADLPCKVGDTISLNVHPDNTDFHFTASGIVVRILEGNAGFSMRFNELSEVALSSITNYVKQT